MVPLITCEASFGQHVSKLVFGINVFDLDFGVQIDSVKQPIKRNSVGSGHASHRRTSALNNHPDYRFIVLNSVKQGSKVKKFCVCGNVIHIEQFNIISVGVFLRLGVGVFPSGFVAQQVSLYRLVFGRMQYFSNQIPEIKSGNTIHAQTNIQKKNFRFN